MTGPTLWPLVWFLAINAMIVAKGLSGHGFDDYSVIEEIVAVAPAARYFLPQAVKNIKGKILGNEFDITTQQVANAADPILKAGKGAKGIVADSDAVDAIDAEFHETEDPGAEQEGAPALIEELPQDQLPTQNLQLAMKTSNLFQVDPVLALVYLRIEIEKRIAKIAKIYDLPYPSPLTRLIREMGYRNLIPVNYSESLIELVKIGNAAAHGAEVESGAANYAHDQGPSILLSLDRLVSMEERRRNEELSKFERLEIATDESDGA